MRLKLYCHRYTHFKDALVCSVNCVYRTRCQDFALFYDEHRDELDTLVADYFDARREPKKSVPTVAANARALPVLHAATAVATPAALRTLIRLEVKREMAEAFYIWIDREDRAELIETEEVLRRAERGAKAKHIYKVAQEMELRFQLVPRKRIDKAKRTAAVEAERADARRSRAAATRKTNNAPVPFPTPAVAANSLEVHDEPAEARAPRRSRTPRVAKG